MKKCPLCKNTDTDLDVKTQNGRFYRCTLCRLVYRDQSEYLQKDIEAARYSLHENDRDNPDYLEYLRTLADKVIPHLQKGSRGLDFGSGQSTGMETLFKVEGHECHSYDSIFFPDTKALLGNADFHFITCCEAIEHFFDPQKEIQVIYDSLMHGGLFGIRTEFYTDSTHLNQWYYAKDPTHVCFYSEKTFQWMEEKWDWHLVEFDQHENRFALFQKG